MRDAFPRFTCPVVRPGDGRSYRLAQYQYASTSQPTELMSPGAIISPRGASADEDVFRALAYARDRGIAVAVRTGGHCYAGTSSTSGKNIQLDLSQSYTDWRYDENTGLIRCGVSRTLHDFKLRLARHRRADGTPDHLFMPVGQCYAVNLGGHCMTGGVGQLTRAFGMLADHVITADVIVADGSRRCIGPASESEQDRALFWAMFGGGPGDYAILTHITFRPLRDADHPYARGFRRVIPYHPRVDTEKLVQLIDLAVKFQHAPQDYDLCISAGSGETGFFGHRLGVTNRDAFMSAFHAPDRPWFVANKSSPAAGLAVFFQYSNLDGQPDSYDPSWVEAIRSALSRGGKGSVFHRFKARGAELLSRTPLLPEARNIDDDLPRPISEMITRHWAFGGVREYSYPFIKNDAITRQETGPGFSRWAAERMNELFRSKADGLMASMQIQQFGGADSGKVKHGARGETSYHWRDGMVVGLNVFYDPSVAGAPDKARAWQQRIDEEGTGDRPGYTSPAMYRWFGFPTGNQVMSEVWPAYFTEENYIQCRDVKRRVDPWGVFSATPFSIGFDLPREREATEVEQYPNSAAADQPERNTPPRAAAIASLAVLEDA